MRSPRPLRLVPAPAEAVLRFDADAPAPLGLDHSGILGRLKEQRQADEAAVAQWAKHVTDLWQLDETAPSLAALEAWLPECPDEAVAEANARLEPLAGQPGRWRLYPAGLRADYQLDDATVTVTVRPADVLAAWQADAEAGGELPPPLNPLIRAWHERPLPDEASRRTTGRIVPARLAQVSPEWADANDGRAHLFSLAGSDPSPEGQILLPGFSDPSTPSPSLPLELYDLGAASEAERRGPAAPLALRLFWESVFLVKQRSRDGRPRAIPIALRDLLASLYEGRQPKPNEYWPRLMAACEALDSDAARLTIKDPDTGRWERRRIVSVGGVPRGPGALDDTVRIVVDLPGGFANGPQVSDNLRFWGTRSALAYRLLLNLAWHWHHPGRTLVPASGGGHWLRSYDHARYEPLTDDQLVRLSYGPEGSARGRWRDRLEKALAVVAALEQNGDLQVAWEGRRERLILPPPPGAGRERH